MVSKDKILRKIGLLEEYLSLLSQIAKTPEDVFLRDKILVGSAKYYLQVSIECCIDMANHVIASKKLRAPRDYSDTFTVIEEAQWTSPELAQRLRQMAKFRNRLVHLYGEIDDSAIYAYINVDIQDLFTFKKTVIEWINCG